MSSETKFKKVGNTIEVHTKIPVEELNSKKVLATLGQFEQAVAQADNQIAQAKQQIEQLEKEKEKRLEILKDLGKHKDWATEIQVSKIKAIVNEVSEECKQAVLDSFVPDSNESQEYNEKAKFLQYQHKVATHARMKDEIHGDIMKEHIYDNPILKNPFA